MTPALPPPLKTTATTVDDTTYVIVSGELDLHTAPRLRELLAKESAHGGTLLVDMSELSFIDSTGMKVLVDACHESRRGGFTLRLTRGSDAVMRAFAMAGLIDELPFLGRPTGNS